MPVPFLRTLRALEADRPRRILLGLVGVAGLAGAWLVWFVAARVPVYEVTATARLEVNQAVHPVDARVAGRVVRTDLVLDRAVKAGDMLVELDAEAERLELEEVRTRLAALAPQVNALEDELTAEKRALDEARQAARVALQEARAHLREAEGPARFAEEEAARFERLHAQLLVPEVEVMRARMEAERRQAQVESLGLTVQRLERDQQTQDSDRRVRLERLQRELAQLEAQAAEATATARRLEYEIERRQIRAPVTGRLGEVADLRAGAFVDEGDTLGAIVPEGTLKVVAEFSPPSALGRIRSGQPARVRLVGFPWTQYGSVAATVASVASEVRAGTVRVELAIDPGNATAIPFQHGLPGTVEVEVERVWPATLVLRAAGRLIARPVSGTTGTGNGVRQ